MKNTRLFFFIIYIVLLIEIVLCFVSVFACIYIFQGNATHMAIGVVVSIVLLLPSIVICAISKGAADEQRHIVDRFNELSEQNERIHKHELSLQEQILKLEKELDNKTK